MYFQSIGRHCHLFVIVLYCLVTCSFLILSLQRHQNVVHWLLHNDWSMFLLWHSEFHCLYLMYHIFNNVFLGPLKLFERRKARKQQLEHLASTVAGIFMVSGFDLLEGFCWLQWATPFGFIRMSICAIKQRVENPITLGVGDDIQSFWQPDSWSPEAPPAASLENLDGQFSSELCSAHLCSRLEENKRVASFPEESVSQAFPSTCYGKNQVLSRCCNRRVYNNRFSPLCFFYTPTGKLALYTLVVSFLLFLSSFIGLSVFKPLPTHIKVLMLYEPAVCILQLLSVSASVILCCCLEDYNALGNRHDFRFLLNWLEDFLCHLLSATRYGLIWLFFGRSLIFNFVDVFIFMKLKSISSRIVASMHSLHVYFSIQNALNKRLPTVYPTPNNAAQQKGSTALVHSPLFSNRISEHDDGRRLTPSKLSRKHRNVVTSTPLAKNGNFRAVSVPPATDAMPPVSPSRTSRLRCVYWFTTFMAFVRREVLAPLHLVTSLHITRRNTPPLLESFLGTECSRYTRQSFCRSSVKQNGETSDASVYPLCVVCRDTISVGKKLPCGHLFHQHCLRQWLEADVTCPVCRSPWLSPRTQRRLRALINTGHSFLSGVRRTEMEE